MSKISIGQSVITPVIEDGFLKSIGSIQVNGVELRNPAHSFMPWFDSFDGLIFDRFKFVDIDQAEHSATLKLIALGRQNHPFQERRDMSGDLCIRIANWDEPPVEVNFNVVFEEASDCIDGIEFQGIRYHFEATAPVKLHRILDRQTWEPGGTLDDHQICCRSWVRPPRCHIGIEDDFSTAGLDTSRDALAKVNPMPGNLWARWSLLPGFDMIYSNKGTLLGIYNEVSLVRTVIETLPGEDCLRIIDMHAFEQTSSFKTNPKTILFSPTQLDSVGAINLWTRMTDRDREMSQKQIGIAQDGPPQITWSQNVWVGMNFDTTYEDAIDKAAELGADYLFIDPIWEHAEAYNMEVAKRIPKEEQDGTLLAKHCGQSMCCTYDFKVADALGGEAGLKRLCDRAAAKGVKILSWVATHMSPTTHFREHAHPELKQGEFGVFAARESGRHPDTGYAGDCWTLNLNAPVFDYVKDCILETCRNTGLAGFLWDSFSNLGWWQIDYSDGSMRPQYDKMAELYKIWSNEGLYLMPEALVAFSNHSCLCLLNGSFVDGDLEAFYYNTAIALPHTLDGSQQAIDKEILRGNQPIDKLFHAFANKWSPNNELWQVPREEWDAENAAAIKRLYQTYKAVRDNMYKRTLLQDELGVDWEGPNGEKLRWCFKDQPAPSTATEVLSGESAGDMLIKHNVYRLN